ncbi:MAG: hypothetical protein LBK60_03125 [Verrucomicrobiales bacterium]|jgi:crossover junction endodeoxyribonuclease RusA|nr:hypothetical protein [Verrucomicrobiales bacterium]
MSALTINLPWPPAAVSPNARVHWSEKHAAIKKMKGWAIWETKCQEDWPHLKAAGYRIVAVVDDRRRRDRDNLAASCKAYLDGIAAALGQDDSAWEFYGVAIEQGAEKRIKIILELAK